MSNSRGSSLLGSSPKGLVFIISAPAGTGKTTLVDMLKSEFSMVKVSISYTTREPRPGEIDGEHYHFVSSARFRELQESGAFLEHVELFGHQYGTSRHWIDAQVDKGCHVVLVIDTQGALALKGKIDAVYTFLSPPSKDELRRRLESRQTETQAVINERLSLAEKEMEAAKHYDYHIVNESLAAAYQILRGIVIAEDHRIR